MDGAGIRVRQSGPSLFYDKTRQFITGHRKHHPGQPFFAVFQPRSPTLPSSRHRNSTERRMRVPAEISSGNLDTLVGRVLDLVNELGIDEETLILFNADNGAETVHVDWMRRDHDHDPSGGWRGMKRDAWEGGHRVPFIARWPGRIPRGQVSGQMTNTTDIFATLASVVGYQLPDHVATDSFDLLPAMLGTQEDSKPIRPHLLTQSFRGEFQIRQGS
ncbi:MAG: sulfatase-like hydrolase/transferase [Verrucomicrobiales bacterium]